METLILASGSPRRKKLLEAMGLSFKIIPAKVDETLKNNASAEKETCRLARAKVEEVLATYPETKSLWVLGADTLIEMDKKIYAKPESKDEAKEMIREFSGKTHRVVTSLALYNPNRQNIMARSEVSLVTFCDLSEADLSWYFGCEDWRGAAGAYKIQERGDALIEKIEGSYTAVVGLPIRLFYGMLKASRYPLI
jgi:septum formation protein